MSETESRAPESDPTEPIEGLLATIAGQARRTNQGRIEQLRVALERASEDGLDRAGWAVAERTAHQLAGSAGTFGFAGVSERARQLEQLFADAVVATPDEARLAAAGVMLDEASAQLDCEPPPA
ncbi:MAG: Hpt domain-containing protein [Microlunatus sp.]